MCTAGAHPSVPLERQNPVDQVLDLILVRRLDDRVGFFVTIVEFRLLAGRDMGGQARRGFRLVLVFHRDVVPSRTFLLLLDRVALETCLLYTSPSPRD